MRFSATVLATVGDHCVYCSVTTSMSGYFAKVSRAAAAWYSAVGTPARPERIATWPLPPISCAIHSA